MQFRRAVVISLTTALVFVVPATAMADGDVGVSVKGGDLVIVGDDGGNHITITQGITPDEFLVEGEGTTTINGVVGPLAFDGVWDDFRITLGAGDDDVSLVGAAVPDNLIIDGGPGRDSTTVIGGSTGRDLRIDYGAGGSGTTLASSRGYSGPAIGRNLTIKAGDGTDNSTVMDTTVGKHARFSFGDGGGYSILAQTTMRTFKYTGRSGDDRLDLFRIETSGVRLDLGAGDNQTILNSSAVAGHFTMKSTNGRDRFSAGDSTIDRNLRITHGTGGSVTDVAITVGGSLTLSSGPGDDLARIYDDTVVGKRVRINQGAGDDTLAFRGARFDGQVTVNQGGGDDTTTSESSLFSSHLTLLSGSGDDVVEVGDDSPDGGTTIGGRTTIKLSGGADALTVTGSVFEGRFLADGGGGIDEYTDGGGNTFSGAVKVKRFEIV